MLQSPPLTSQFVPVGGTYREMTTNVAGTVEETLDVFPKSIGAFVTIVRSPSSDRPSSEIIVFFVGWVCQIAYVPLMFDRLTAANDDTAVADVVAWAQVAPVG